MNMQVPDTLYPVIRNQPIAKFRYKGNHSKPVRRTVFLTEVTRGILRGYEVREGNDTRDPEDEVIKSFSRDKILDLERFSMTGCDSI
jgi:hypothetical protein